ncbi:MAG: SPOR domain-containing protein [Betaproteobacteria bacterium]
MRAAADANLDELKKKARRRLVGAIVLALAAAVFVPMLLESDERPLGDDVSVRIPPVDQGRFVNRLNSPQPASGSKTPATSTPPKSAAPLPRSDATPASADDAVAGNKDSSPASASPPAVASLPAVASPPAAASSPLPAMGNGNDNAAAAKSTSDGDARATKSATPAPKPDATPQSASAASADTKTSNAAPATARATVASAPAAKSAHGGFVVQLAAFADDKGANALANRLKRSGHPAFTEPVSTSRGTLWRVRVGPYSSRDEASAARDKLKREGQSGIVAARAS